MIKVVHVKNYGKADKQVDGGNYVYIGRPSVYGNKYWMQSEEYREMVIAKFEQCQLSTMNLSNLVKLATQGDLYLGCYCSPKQCHGDKIKEQIKKLL